MKGGVYNLASRARHSETSNFSSFDCHLINYSKPTSRDWSQLISVVSNAIIGKIISYGYDRNT
jgi:hypothetical protein